MKKYTVGKAATGLARFLLDTYGEEEKNRGITLSYDARNNAEFFARVTADVLSAFVIQVFLHAHVRPAIEVQIGDELTEDNIERLAWNWK